MARKSSRNTQADKATKTGKTDETAPVNEAVTPEAEVTPVSTAGGTQGFFPNNPNTTPANGDATEATKVEEAKDATATANGETTAEQSAAEGQATEVQASASVVAAGGENEATDEPAAEQQPQEADKPRIALTVTTRVNFNNRTIAPGDYTEDQVEEFQIDRESKDDAREILRLISSGVFVVPDIDTEEAQDALLAHFGEKS